MSTPPYNLTDWFFVRPEKAAEMLRQAYWAIEDGDHRFAQQLIVDVGHELAIDGALLQREDMRRDFGPACVQN